MKNAIYLPSIPLVPYIKHFVLSEDGDGRAYKVLPDTCLVIGFQYRGALSVLVSGAEKYLDKAGITGIMDTYRVFKGTPGIGTALVVFKPGGASAFFKAPLHELFDQSLGLDSLVPACEISVVEEQLAVATDDIKRIAILERFLLSKLRKGPADLLVVAAMGLIYQAKGRIRIAELSQKLYISQSPLEKRFRRDTGTTPKKFATIVRMRNVIASHKPEQAMTGLGLDAGYYDQAHFIKDFKSFTGHTPEGFFRKPQ